MNYTLYEQNVIFFAEEFSKDPCEHTLHNLVTMARMNDLRGFALMQCSEDIIDSEIWFERLNDELFPKAMVRTKSGELVYLRTEIEE